MNISDIKTLAKKHFGYTNNGQVNTFIEKVKVKAIDGLPDSIFNEILDGYTKTYDLLISEVFNEALNEYGIPDHAGSNRFCDGSVLILVSKNELKNPIAFWLFDNDKFECKSISSYSKYRLSDGIPKELLSSTIDYYFNDFKLSDTSFTDKDGIQINGVLYSTTNDPTKVFEVEFIETGNPSYRDYVVHGNVCDKMINFMKKNFHTVNVSPFYFRGEALEINCNSLEFAKVLTDRKFRVN